jgi:excinuclease ABC subunit B
MHRAVSEMERRRVKQLDYNREHGITPQSIVKTTEEILAATSVADRFTEKPESEAEALGALEGLHREMAEAVVALEFERAAQIRDKIRAIQRKIELAEGRKQINDRHGRQETGK